MTPRGSMIGYQGDHLHAEHHADDEGDAHREQISIAPCLCGIGLERQSGHHFL